MHGNEGYIKWAPPPPPANLRMRFEKSQDVSAGDMIRIIVAKED